MFSFLDFCHRFGIEKEGFEERVQENTLMKKKKIDIWIHIKISKQYQNKMK